MDNYSDHCEVLVELGRGYLKGDISTVAAEINRSTKTLTIFWFRYEENKYCLNVCDPSFR